MDLHIKTVVLNTASCIASTGRKKKKVSAAIKCCKKKGGGGRKKKKKELYIHKTSFFSYPSLLKTSGTKRLSGIAKQVLESSSKQK